MRVSVILSATTWTIICPSSLRAVNCVYSNLWSGNCDPSQPLPEDVLQPLPPFLPLRTSLGSVLWAWPWVGAGCSVDSGFSIQLRERICQEPGVESCFSPNLTKVLMYRVASLPGPFLCQSDAPFPKKAGACNGKRPVVISPVKQSTFWGRGNKSHLWSTPGLQGIPDPLQFPSPLVFKLCAFDHLLGLKIFYAKSFQVPEFKDRGADTFLASGTLPSSYSASPPVWVGRTERQGWQLCPLSLGIQNP